MSPFAINLFTASLLQERPPARRLPRRNFSKIHHRKPFREKNPNRICKHNMHTNTIAIFLVEITTNECLKSYNNLLYYFLKYGKIAKFENFG
jgi:hypothetical protein